MTDATGPRRWSTIERSASVVWDGSLEDGSGSLTVDESQVMIAMPLHWEARIGEAVGRTNPEELLAAAQASCYAMALTAQLARAGARPGRVTVRATSMLSKGPDGLAIIGMRIAAVGEGLGIDRDLFERTARTAVERCPVSRALSPDIRVELELDLTDDVRASRA